MTFSGTTRSYEPLDFLVDVLARARTWRADHDKLLGSAKMFFQVAKIIAGLEIVRIPENVQVTTGRIHLFRRRVSLKRLFQTRDKRRVLARIADKDIVRERSSRYWGQRQ